VPLRIFALGGNRGQPDLRDFLLPLRQINHQHIPARLFIKAELTLDRVIAAADTWGGARRKGSRNREMDFPDKHHVSAQTLRKAE